MSRLRSGSFGLATLALAMIAPAALAVDAYTPGSETDPHLRAAAFLTETHTHFSAATQLLQIEQRPGAALAPDFRWLLAENYLSFGQPDRAQAIYRELAITSDKDELLKWNKAQLRLAEFQYQRSYFAEARATLLQVRGKLPESLLPDWQDLLARVLMSMSRNSEAVQILTEPKNGNDFNDLTRFNLGVALIGDGRTAQGRTILDRVGRIDPTDALTLALRDRANLTLGWSFLKDRQGAAAKPVFGRIRSQGPFSNRALLGLGWAELAPGQGRVKREALDDQPQEQNAPTSFSTLGVLLRRGFLDPEEYANFNRLRNFRRSKTATVEDDALRRALVSWIELIDRDPQDPAVQEGWMAIPFALDRIGAHTQAMDFYEQAATKLEASRARTVTALASIKSGRMVETIVRRDLESEAGWAWEVKDLPDAPETYYLQNLIAEHRFAEALKNYRDVRMMARAMDGWKVRLETARKAYVSADRQTVDPRILVARVTDNIKAPLQALDLELEEELNLSAPGQYDARAPAVTVDLKPLKLSEVPQRFEGPYEKLDALKKRMETLRPALAQAGAAQSRLLEQMATHELEGQKKQIEKYLVECRFALARLYDRATQDSDPDEFEIVK